MGAICCRCHREKLTDQINIAVFGCDGAGKTTVIKALLGENVNDVAQTIGFRAHELKRDPFSLIRLYDVGGDVRIRDIWKSYLHEVYGLIFVVDALNGNRFDETRDALHDIWSHPKMQTKPVLLLLNKHDRDVNPDHALNQIDADERLQLVEAVNHYKSPCRIEVCSALQGSGKRCHSNIAAGFDWLLQRIYLNLDYLKGRVERDAIIEKHRLAIQRQERMDRIEQLRKNEERDQIDNENQMNNHENGGIHNQAYTPTLSNIVEENQDDLSIQVKSGIATDENRTVDDGKLPHIDATTNYGSKQVSYLNSSASHSLPEISPKIGRKIVIQTQIDNSDHSNRSSRTSKSKVESLPPIHRTSTATSIKSKASTQLILDNLTQSMTHDLNDVIETPIDLPNPDRTSDISSNKSGTPSTLAQTSESNSTSVRRKRQSRFERIAKHRERQSVSDISQSERGVDNHSFKNDETEIKNDASKESVTKM